MLRRAFLFL